MADVGLKSVGEINVKKCFKGFARTFAIYHPADLAAVGISASVDNAGVAVPLGVIKSTYDATLKYTKVTFNLTAALSATLDKGTLSWMCIFTYNLVDKPYFTGTFEVL